LFSAQDREEAASGLLSVLVSFQAEREEKTMIKQAFKTYLSRHVELIAFALGISLFRVAMEASGEPRLAGREMLMWTGVLCVTILFYAGARALWDQCRAYYRRLRLFWTAWRRLPNDVCPVCQKMSGLVNQEKVRA
jgi:hypothetical protein